MKTLLKALLIILFILFVSYWLFADQLIKAQAENALTNAHGAEVNIGDFSHSLWPTQITVTDIAFTDPAKPEQNQYHIEQLNADAELLPLFSGRLISEQVTVQELAFAQPRQTPGAVLRVPDSQQTFGLPLPDSLPTVEQLLAHSPLKTTAAAQNAQATYEKHAATLQTHYQALPDKTVLEEYKAEWEQLKNTDYKNPEALLTAKERLAQLKQRVLADKEKIIAFKEASTTARSELAEAASALKQAPSEDYQLLQGLVAGDQAAIDEISQRLFGEQAAQYTQYLTFAIQSLAPMLSGEGQGDDAPPLTPETLPNVWIKQAQVSVRLNDQLISSDWKNIIDNHLFIQQPTTFSVKASQSPLWQSLLTNGQFEIGQAGIQAAQQWQIQGLNVEQLDLSANERLKAQMLSALANIEGQLTIQDSQLNGQSSVDLAQLALEAVGQDSFTQAIAGALNGLQKLRIQLGLDGTLQRPSISLSSDLDTQLAGQLVSQLTTEQQTLLTDLNNALVSEAEGPLAATNSQLQQLIQWQTAADSDIDSLEAITSGQLNDVVEQQKNKLFDKLKQKLDGKSG